MPLTKMLLEEQTETPLQKTLSLSCYVVVLVLSLILKTAAGRILDGFHFNKAVVFRI